MKTEASKSDGRRLWMVCYKTDPSSFQTYWNVHAPVAQAEPVHQWRYAGSCNWYDGYPDTEDGGGPYETRTLFAAPVAATPAPAPQVLDFKCQLPGQEILHVSHDGVFTWHKDADKLIEEMDATGTKHILLALRRAATPAQAQQVEPAGTVLTASDFEGRVRWWRPGKQPQLDDKLYAAPVAQAEPRKPLTDEQVAAMAKKSEFTTTACYSQAWYRAQVRAVEAAHGIGANSGGAA